MSAEIGSIPAEVMAQMQQAAQRAAEGRRDPEEMEKAAQRMDLLSEQIRQEHGVLDIAVPAIRELREGECDT